MDRHRGMCRDLNVPGAIGFVSLINEKGQKLPDVFLEVNANLCGNQVGRAFEMKPGTAADPRPQPESAMVTFAVNDPH